MTLVINNWAENFEKADNRRLKIFSWVAVPTKMDGKKFRRLAKVKNGLEIFGAFILLLELAGKMPSKGALRDADGDLSFEDMELMTGFPAKQFENAVSVLISPEIGWLSDNTRAAPGRHSTYSTEQNSTKQNRTDMMSEQHKTEITEIINFLNSTCKTNYRHQTKKNKDLIKARLKEGFSVKDFKDVIEKKSKAWINDPKFCMYLRPQTLFGTKFESYLNEHGPKTIEELMQEQE